MAIVDLKQGSLEQKLAVIGVPAEEKRQVLREIWFYDEYYFLPQSGKFVKAFRQEFVKDPFMDLKPISEVRLVAYDPASTNIGELEEIFGMDTTPVITRIHQKTIPDFVDIPNVYGGRSILNPIRINISPEYPDYISPRIKQMHRAHLPIIGELFRNQYSLRYRFVDPMWNDCPDACFVYVKGGDIVGVTFNRIEGNTLYMRQIFVHEDYRARGIGEQLYLQRLSLARKMGLKFASAHARAEALWFHEKFGARICGNDEYYVIKGKS